MMYRIGEGWSPSLEQMEQALDAERFVACGASQEKAIGWVEPRGEAHGPLIEAVSGQRILKLKIEIKMDNAAFGYEPWCEVANMLQEYVKGLEEGGDMQKSLFDSTGNAVGFAKVTK